MEHREIVEIIKEARKAGVQTALLMFGSLLVVGGLFAYFIYGTFENSGESIEAYQNNENGDNSISQEIK